MHRVYINDGYIISVAHNAASGNVTEEDYARIEEAIRNKPTPPSGFDYRLRGNLTWELYALPQPTDAVE